MTETQRPELRYVKTHLALELPPQFESAEGRDQFLDDLVAVFEKHGMRAERGTFTSGTGATTAMITFPYGIAD